MCNDGNANTIGDVWDELCGCHGISLFDCEGTPGGNALPGTPCDDGDIDTVDDTWSLNCVCIGDMSTPVEAVEGTNVRSWPNPATDVLRVTMGMGYASLRLWIIDQQGRTVMAMNRAVIRGMLEIPLAGVADGMYSLRMEGPGVLCGHHFVVSR